MRNGTRKRKTRGERRSVVVQRAGKEGAKPDGCKEGAGKRKPPDVSGNREMAWAQKGEKAEVIGMAQRRQLNEKDSQRRGDAAATHQEGQSQRGHPTARTTGRRGGKAEETRAVAKRRRINRRGRLCGERMSAGSGQGQEHAGEQE